MERSKQRVASWQITLQGDPFIFYKIKKQTDSHSVIGCLSALLLGGDHAIDGLSLLKLLLHLNHQLDSVNHQLDLVHLRGAQTVSVGDVEHTTHRGCVHTTWRERKGRQISPLSKVAVGEETDPHLH